MVRLFSLVLETIIIGVLFTGDEAIAHGINETEVTTVITSYELMPKFKKVLALTPKVKTLVYMEDQLKDLDKTGYADGINIYSFTDVVKKGKESKFGVYQLLFQFRRNLYSELDSFLLECSVL